MFEFLVLLILPHINMTSDDQIFTTYRDDGNYTVWDGKWTFLQEWKRTSLTTVYGENFMIRTGHDYRNLYVFLDLLSQKKFSKHSDYAVVCISSNSTVENSLGYDDQCFLVTLGSQNPLTFRGGGIITTSNHFTKIENDPNLIGIGNISDENDRYSSIPHASYEFRIPIETIGRSDVYKFYTAVYDSNDNRIYNWPENLSGEIFPNMPPPSSWGQLVSPDKSLPEFPWTVFTLIFAFLVIFFFNWKKFLGLNPFIIQKVKIYK